MTSIPTDKLPQLFATQDKLEHFVAYFILGFLLNMSFTFQERTIFIKRNSFKLSLVIIIFYAFLDEIHQLLIPGRYCDFFDWLFDLIGGTIGIVVSYYLLKKNLREKI